MKSVVARRRFFFELAQRLALLKHGAGAGVDSVREQEKTRSQCLDKLDNQKMLDAKRAAESQKSVSRFVGQPALAQGLLISGTGAFWRRLERERKASA